jgi:hypothetical protein
VKSSNVRTLTHALLSAVLTTSFVRFAMTSSFWLWLRLNADFCLQQLLQTLLCARWELPEKSLTVLSGRCRRDSNAGANRIGVRRPRSASRAPRLNFEAGFHGDQTALLVYKLAHRY